MSEKEHEAIAEPESTAANLDNEDAAGEFGWGRLFVRCMRSGRLL